MPDERDPIDPMRLTVEQAAKLLSAAYRERIDVEKIKADVDSGAPTNADGTINLVNYAAWEVQEISNAD
jgi:hypothetical protein